MMLSVARQALRNVKVGDVIFGIAAGGQEKLLLVYDADADGFSARHVTSQTKIRFGWDGKSRWAEGGGSCTIVSTARLPADMYNVATGLDRKFAAKPEYPDSILTKAEIDLVLNHDKFFRTHLLPGAAPLVKWAEKINGVRAILQMEWDPIAARGNPPDWNEYLGDLPILVDLLDKPATIAEVEAFLSQIAARAMRTQQVDRRGSTTATSLVRLRDSWA
jgi:hypothetical protein